MRLYELSKKLGVPAKKLLEVLHQEGIQVKSHMSALDDSSITLLQNKFGAQEKSEPKVPEQKSKSLMQTQPQPSEQNKKSRPTTSVTSSVPKVSQEKPSVSVASSSVKEIILKPMTVSEVAQKLGILVNDVILTMLGWRIIAAKNQLISEDTIAKLARHYGVEPVKFREARREDLTSLAVETTGKLQERLPVIVVLGHVDHGKTTLLDFIRKTRVVAKEKGGITQHLGAYEATTKHGNIVFLDTPGHEAFPKMRQRGIRVADIGVLVIAAEDGIMPQTVEAIKHLKTMGIPIIVAINKIDKADPVRIETVKRQLAEQDMLPEEWGGQTICIPISALYGTGVDQLLEMIALQAELLELRASRTSDARGFVLESKLERGRGPVATLILQSGTLHVGDYFVCGKTVGKVSSIKNSFGKTVQEVIPSIPVLVAGFNELPEVGDVLHVVSKDEFKHDKQQRTHVSFASQTTSEDTINLILKTDTNSSKEAVIDSINKLTKKLDIGFGIVYAGVGNVNESDIELAYNTDATIIGLHVKAESNALLLAQRRKVTMDLYMIIYKLLEALEERAERAKPVEKVRTKIGEAVVRRVFDIKGVGVIAGSYVQDGRFSKDGYAVGWRGRQKIGEGKITSLQRDKKTVKEVHAGYECGFVVAGMTDWEVDDRIECFVDLPK
jgi:translation initiation factor IF-2